MGNVLTNLKNAFFGAEQKASDVAVDPGGSQFNGSMIKGIIPQYIYRPPFGFPREQDVVLNRKLGANAYVHSIVSTIQFEVSSTPYDIVVKEDETESPEQVKKLKEFFNNPNGNAESFSFILRALVKDILELDSGILMKVFDGAGNFKQIFARDGASFYKNPDIHGYMGDRDDIIPQYYFHYNAEKRVYEFLNRFEDKDSINAIRDTAAYFQYGYNNASVPIPFGKREIVWISANPRTESVYGRSPIDVLGDVIYTILYGATFNLDFYLNNNIPDGVIQLIGANNEHIRQFRERWEANFTEKDVFDNKRKKFFTFPITNAEAKFTPFAFNSKDMEVLEQQKWFWKIVMACFGVTPSEMGFTEDSNKATELVQSSVFKRKAVAPLLDIIEYHINLSIMPELDPTGKYKFQFIDTDLEQDTKKATLEKMYIDMGVKTPEMVAEEMGIDVKRLKKEKEEKRQQEMQAQDNFTFGQEQEQKSVVDETLPGLDEYFANVTSELNELLTTLPDSDNNRLGDVQ